MLAAVEDAVTEVMKDKAKFKAMKPAVARIISRLKLTVKKHNKNFESDLADFREHPDAYDTPDESDSSDSDSDSDSDEESDEDEAEEESEDDLMKKPKQKVSTFPSFCTYFSRRCRDDTTFLVTDSGSFREEGVHAIN
jgi:translation initiation factor 3 subunit C